jgi:UDP-3-O-[3-hydroxymyristoyl] glucosamine N-acyltransferase
LAKNAEWEKTAAVVRQLGSMRERVRALEKLVKQHGIEPHSDKKIGE